MKITILNMVTFNSEYNKKKERKQPVMLTPDQQEFIADYSWFVQKWSSPKVANKVLNVSKETARLHKIAKGGQRDK